MSTSTSKPLKPKRGTTAQNNGYTGEAYEVTLDTDKKTLVVHDGLTAGGFPLARADEVAVKDAAQNAAIEEAKSSADAKVSALEALLRDLIEDEKATLEAQIQNTVPAGTVVAFAANSTPDGFLLCNGAAVSRTTYAKLYAAIGATYGTGDGSSTFKLPNLTDGRFIEGSHTSGAYIEAGLPDVTGSFQTIAIGADSSNYQGAFYMASFANGAYSGTGSGAHIHYGFEASRVNSNYGKSHTVQPQALTMRFYIKY